MAVLMSMEWAGIKPEQYEAARELVGWERDPAPGGLYHAAAFDESGLRVVDVWESAEACQSFFQSRLMPGVKRLGIEGEPKVILTPIHRVFAPGYQPVS